ncbi:hypothetical protein IC63_08600 [Paracoccus sphaerophysae]|uniref:Uncharacterized protein n=1 Tax=Paracoccus sphaerophysae TaxID=690417 RepID=A0A099FB66_9RHOB|nr:hypothetical protein IC63_08600 [Paracoccus sphaerophysae]
MLVLSVGRAGRPAHFGPRAQTYRRLPRYRWDAVSAQAGPRVTPAGDAARDAAAGKIGWSG